MYIEQAKIWLDLIWRPHIFKEIIIKRRRVLQSKLDCAQKLTLAAPSVAIDAAVYRNVASCGPRGFTWTCTSMSIYLCL